MLAKSWLTTVVYAALYLSQNGCTNTFGSTVRINQRCPNHFKPTTSSSGWPCFKSTTSTFTVTLKYQEDFTL